MIPALILAALGALVGWMRAARRGGTGADKSQYAAVHAIALFLIGMAVMTVAGHMGWLDTL